MSRISRREFAALTAGGLLAQSGQPTARQLVDRIQQNMGVPWNPKSYRDTFKAGNPDTAVKGIASTFMSTLDMLQRASARGLNFVITHEPTFWSDRDTTDTLTTDPLFKFKTDFVEKNKMIVWRSHDHWHQRRPDGIFSGWNKALGWESYLSADDPRIYNLPPTTLDAVARHMARRLKTRSIRVVGDPKLKVAKVGRGSHALDANMAMLPTVDLILVSEARERETIEYVRDTVQAGQAKGMILISHEAGEEAGMDEFALWQRTIVKEVPVEFVPTNDAFWMPA
jgi:putative NIF3 family GTP cyclohydrolase 1 type 2